MEQLKHWNLIQAADIAADAQRMARQIEEVGDLLIASKRGGLEVDVEAVGGLIVNMATLIQGRLDEASSAIGTARAELREEATA